MASVCPFGSILKLKNILISFSLSPSEYPGLHSNSDFGCRPWEYKLNKRSFFVLIQLPTSILKALSEVHYFPGLTLLFLTTVYYRMLGLPGSVYNFKRRFGHTKIFSLWIEFLIWASDFYDPLPQASYKISDITEHPTSLVVPGPSWYQLGIKLTFKKMIL